MKNHIYPIGSIANRPEAHASSITQLPDKDGYKRLMAVWFCGTKEGHKDVAILKSIITYKVKGNNKDKNNIKTDENGGASGLIEPIHYSEPEILADVEDRALGNPVIFYNPITHVLHFWYAILSPQHGKPEKIMYSRSKNEGIDWSEAVDISPREGIWPRNLPIILRSKPHLNRLLLPLNDELTFDKKYKTYWSSGFAYSDDDGEHWHHTRYIFSKKGNIQPAIAELDNGKIYAIMRGRKGFAWESFSSDGGLTWTTPQKTDVPNPNSNIAITKLNNNDLVMVCNPVKHGRKVLSLFYSPMNSNKRPKWKRLFDLENSTLNTKERDLRIHRIKSNLKNMDSLDKLYTSKYSEYSYPCIIQSDDNLIHIIYTFGRKTIEHVLFDPDFLKYLKAQGSH
ncbi:MAG: exo-alpha-sialidase [Promethearchaeota archaeon]